MSWKEFRERAKIVEESFAKNLIDPVWANDYQDMHEHWDVEGTLDNKLLKFLSIFSKSLLCQPP